ncbi:DUF1993 family protein [Novosphingobium sp. 2638]|uniref:DUF1993 family protein n=2 Tax=Novosphingobium beihaiensis TaxID=2930389 RepID=A0ABT0BR85_9SPHN|nr:DUF1993 family protein [Novosphingobium beihaiensis]MCJ2187573.1 DUF1993 family protein [Novosphingobium beihaiensis]
MLRALSGWLDKAQKQLAGAEAEALLSERLAPDMYPLSSQIRFICLQAQEATFRLRGELVPERLDELAAEGRGAGEQPGDRAGQGGLRAAHVRLSPAGDCRAGLSAQSTLRCPPQHPRRSTPPRPSSHCRRCA